MNARNGTNTPALLETAPRLPLDTIQFLCAAWIERAAALGYRGKRRDEAAIDYFAGAIMALHHAGMDTGGLHAWTAYGLAFRGHPYIVETAALLAQPAGDGGTP